VDIKKLKFIFLAIKRYSDIRNKSFNDLSILEVGCGKGGICLAMAAVGCKTKAFDVNEDRIGYIRGLIEQRRINNLEVIIDNGYTFNDGMIYDIVVISEVLEHTSQPSKLIANIAKRMRAGSHCIVTIPNGYGPWEIKNRVNPINYLRKMNWLRQCFGKPPYVERIGAKHCYFFTKKNLVKSFLNFRFKLMGFGKSDTFLSMFEGIRKNRLIGGIDIALADILPYWLAGGWYFVFELQNPA
jgi:SAM-dependent methyltransferase